MSDDRWQRIERLFEEAKLRPSGDRAAFLASECGDDVALRHEVESLLAHADSQDGFLDTPAADMLANREGPASVGSLIGCSFGGYRIVSLLGVGGMGEVYLARDSRLDRDVAVKVLPPQLMADPERRVRFQREARMLAAFSHPHIGAIHGLEDCDGRQALVLEYVPGDTLEDRIRRGPMPVAVALAIARQIAEAIDVAHEKGIVHRDLKPANVKVSADGRVKVLDFGLAKATAGERPGPDVSGRSAMTASPTEAGRLIGTPRYMSPEQARGEVVDKRADIWAFGCVLYEMLTGRPAMTGDTLVDVIASVLERTPDWTRLPASTPPAVRRLIQRCLEKDPARRLRDIGDARIELDEAQDVGDALRPAASEGSGRRVRLPLVMGSLALLVVAAGAWFTVVSRQGGAQPAGHLDLTVTAPEGTVLNTLSGIAVSPDGSAVAFVAGQRLWLRTLSESTPRELPGTAGAANPFWSSDGRALGFSSEQTLRTIRLDGGAPVDVASAVTRGGTWAADGSILFGTDSGPISRVSSGGRPEAVTTLQPGETAHRWPWLLPDGDHFLYFVARPQGNELRIGALSSRTTVSLGPIQSHAIYAGGHLLFLQRGNLMVQEFDVRRLALAGTSRLLAGATAINAWGLGAFSSSDGGVLARIETVSGRRQLTWMTASGPGGTVGPPGQFFNLALSSDGRKVAVSMLTGSPANVDIWVMDLAREGAATRVTTGAGMEFDPAWTRDGRTILFNSNETGVFQLMQHAASGDGTDEPVLRTDLGVGAPNVSPDGRVVVFNRTTVASGADLWTMPFSGEGTARVFLATKSSEGSGSFSPDGHWVVYASDASGDRQVYIRPFPAAPGQVLVSRDGGWAPEWSRDGKTVYFLDPDGTMMAASVEVRGGVMSVGLPKPLFETELLPGNNRPYAVAPDGRFLVPLRDRTYRPETIALVLNWAAKLRK